MIPSQRGLRGGADLPGIEEIDGVGGTPGHRYDINIACPDGGAL